MRTKLLLVAAAITAVGLATCLADGSNVYSQNVVGYINVTCPAGYSIIANQFDNGTGINTVSGLLPTVENGTAVVKYVPGTGYVGNSYVGGWGTPSMTLNPGEACFYYAPHATTNTFVGNVLQGSLTNGLSTGYSLVSSIVPQAGLVNTDLGWPVSNGSTVVRYVPGTGYVGYSYVGGWGTEPTIGLAEGFFSYKPAGVNWVRVFNVQ